MLSVSELLVRGIHGSVFVQPLFEGNFNELTVQATDYGKLARIIRRGMSNLLSSQPSDLLR